jgi:hypothetical protein
MNLAAWIAIGLLVFGLLVALVVGFILEQRRRVDEADIQDVRNP